jgi:hypothetical protein
LNALLAIGLVLAAVSISVSATLALVRGEASALVFGAAGLGAAVLFILGGLARLGGGAAREEEAPARPPPLPLLEDTGGAAGRGPDLAARGGGARRRVRAPGALAKREDSGAAPLPGLDSVYERIAKGEIRGHLQVIAGPERGRAADLAHQGKVSVGRSREHALRLSDGGVSVDQCEFVDEGGGVVVKDLGSKNGTFVNGDKVDARRLANCDVVAVGGSRILVTLEASDGAVTE